MDSERSYSYQGPISLREGITMEAGDEIVLSGPVAMNPEHLCDAVARTFGLRRDGAWINVRIEIEEVSVDAATE